MQAEKQSVVLSGRLNLPSLATAWKALPPSSEQPVVFDLTAASWADVGALAAIIATVRNRDKLGLKTILRLPIAGGARGVMASTRFQFGFESAVRQKLQNYVSPDQRQLFEEGRLTDSSAPDSLCMSEAAHQLQDRNFFTFRSWDSEHAHPRIDLDALKRNLKAQDVRWSDDLLNALLGRQLGLERSGYVTSHIVYESLSNAFRHANSTVILSAEQITDSPDASSCSGNRQLDIAHWDDGEPMHRTLRAAVESGKEIYKAHPDDSQIVFHVTGTENIEKFTFKDVAKLSRPSDAGDELYFLAAFLPGVTSELDGFGAVYHQLLRDRFPILAAPGKGLFNMINAVCFFFGGTATAWCGDRTLSFTANRERSTANPRVAAFDVTCGRLPINGFSGNLVAVTLPLRG